MSGLAGAIVGERQADRRSSFRADRPAGVVHGELLRAALPFVINGSLLEPPYALSRMGYRDHARLHEAWAQLDGKCDGQGRYVLDWHPQGYFRPGPKGQPSKWATLYAYLALKHGEHDRVPASKEGF